jgi:hypothetical protein
MSLGIGRGTGDSSAAYQGCVEPREGSKILTFLFRSRLMCRARFYISEARGREILRS